MAVFDKKADDYDRWYESKLGKFVDKVETELAFSLFEPVPGMKILDMGCGTGNFSIKLAEKGCKVFGIDISEEMLKKAREKAQKRNLDIEFYNMDVYNINFPGESFDGIFSMAAFEFIKEPQKAYDEMYRVLKRNGYLLIGTINRKSKWGEFYVSRSLRRNSIFKHADFKSMGDLKSLNSKEIINSGECLFIPPDMEENNINMEFEKKLSYSGSGGFICVLWKKRK
ncbi:MAG: class I SAM-dependent methyltransferase [Natronincolaceae bacterium]|jgi:ubiquinone/menaquinone biosynthesis C-methylase UbiE|nr:methyltransferase domain-containing protein [Bacillota bacterium]NLK90343.1 methyltransferase domain-containing protein [Clostridiales bacterium]